MNEWFEAEQHVERAQMLSESQRFAEALEEIEAALSTNPNHASWQAQRGYLLEELERFEDAVRAYEKSLLIEPGDPEVSVALAHAEMRLGRFAHALELLEGLAREHPDFEPAYCHRIAVYAELGRHDQAEEMFYLAQTLDDACPQCFYHMGASLAARGQFDRAIYCWRRVLELDPDAMGVNLRVAQACRAKGDVERAREYYLRELRDDPGNTDLLYEMAEVALDAGDVTGAAAKLLQIIELEPDHAEAHFALAKTWLLRQDGEQALRQLEKAKSIVDDTSDLPGYEQSCGEAYLLLGRFNEARDHLTAAVDAERDPSRPLLLLGTCLLAIRRVLANDSENFIAHQQLAVCMMRQGRVSAGIEHGQAALASKPDFAPALSVTAYGYLRQGQWEAARGMLRKTLGEDAGPRDIQKLDTQIWKFRLKHYLGKVLRLFSWIGRPR
jgi:tetratricopeptide (TPR) repeat protein